MGDNTIKYRDNLGDIEESTAQAIEVCSLDEIKTHLNKYLTQYGKEVEQLKLSHPFFDDRNGWHSYPVMQKLKGEKHFTVAGVTNGKFKP